MPSHDDFQLDVNKVNSNEQTPSGSGIISWISGTVVTSIITGCTGNCLSTYCDNITRNTGCTVTHPRCKG